MSDLTELAEKLVKATVAELMEPLNAMYRQLHEERATSKQREIVLRAHLIAVRSVEALIKHQLREVSNG